MKTGLLDRILEPVGVESFIAEYWTRKPALLQHCDRDRFEGLFDLDTLEEYLFIARPALPEVQLVQRGQWPPAAELHRIMEGPTYSTQGAFRALNEGYTVVLNAVHERWPAVRRLVLEVEERLQCTGQTNVYATGRAARGFNVHVDEHDVFVVQTYGAKHWVVYDKPEGQSGQGELLFDVELKQGDVLYLPTGYPHAASTTGDYAIHLALGVFQYTWRDLVVDLVGHVAGRNPDLQEAVPMALLQSDPPPGRIGELARQLVADLEELQDVPKLIDAYRRGRTVSAQSLNPPPSGYGRAMYSADELGPNTRVSRRPGVTCGVRSVGQSAEISFLGEMISMPARAEAALRFVAANETFRLGELPGEFSDDSRCVLVRRLIREGLLQFDPG